MAFKFQLFLKCKNSLHNFIGDCELFKSMAFIPSSGTGMHVSQNLKFRFLDVQRRKNVSQRGCFWSNKILYSNYGNRPREVPWHPMWGSSFKVHGSSLKSAYLKLPGTVVLSNKTNKNKKGPSQKNLVDMEQFKSQTSPAYIYYHGNMQIKWGNIKNSQQK